MLGVHCGFTELEIDEFTYIFYKDCIGELAIKFQYDAISHILANPYAGEQGTQMLQDNNPFNLSIEDDKKKKPKRLTMADLEASGVVK